MYVCLYIYTHCLQNDETYKRVHWLSVYFHVIEIWTWPFRFFSRAGISLSVSISLLISFYFFSTAFNNSSWRVASESLLCVTMWNDIYYFHAIWTLSPSYARSLGNGLYALELDWLVRERNAASPNKFDLKILDSINDSLFPQRAISISNYTHKYRKERVKLTPHFHFVSVFIISFLFFFIFQIVCASLKYSINSILLLYTWLFEMVRNILRLQSYIVTHSKAHRQKRRSLT